MLVLLVTYNLKSEKDYSGLYEQLKTAKNWWHYLDSTWLIVTEKSPIDWTKSLRPHIDSVEDSMLIVEIKNNYSGWLSRKAWDWIKRELPKQ